jgi:hypothetical protein
MRLRVFDLSTPFGWIVVFFQREYGKPAVELNIFRRTRKSRWWFHCWKWEPIPDERPAWQFLGTPPHPTTKWEDLV